MNKKKLAAAISAVMTYIKTEEEAAAYYASQASQPLDEAPVMSHPQQVLPPQNTWGLSGRQTQMQANTMMQLRMFK